MFICQAITAPATVLNAITIAAYKKFVLVSLIQLGLVRLLILFIFRDVLKSVSFTRGMLSSQ